MTTRRRTSRALLAIGAIAAYFAVIGGYARSELFDSSSFGDRTVEAVRKEPVRAALGEAFADQLIEQQPQLIAARPLLISGAEGVLASRASGGLISRAAADLHRGVLTTDQPSIVIDLADLTVLAQAYLRSQGSQIELAQLHRAPTELLTTLSQRTVALKVAERATRVSVIAFIAPIVALLAFAGAVLTGGDRRRTLRDAGLVLMLVGGAVVATQVAITGIAAARLPSGAPIEIALSVVDAYLGDLTTWAFVTAAVGALLAASAASLMGPVDATRLPELLWQRLSHVPDATGPRLARAAGLVVIGVLVVGSPTGALTLAATAIGGYVALVGLTTLLAAVLGPRSNDPQAAPLRRRAVLTTAIAALVLPVVASLALAAGADNATTKANGAVAASDACNGSAALCDRRLDQIVLPTVHNANSSAAAGYLNANNGPDMITQLDMGIRGLLIDALAGQRNSSGVVRTDLTGTTEDTVVDQIGAEGLATAQRLAGRVAFGPIEGRKRLYLCHVLCELGASDAVTELRRIREWVDGHPREVLMIFIQDEASPEMITAALQESGLDAYAPTLHLGRTLPTLRQLIAANRRVVLFAENRAGAPWYPKGFPFVQDTPFSFTSTKQLETDASCAPNRGPSSAPMLLLNHWVETYPPNPRNAEVVNQKAFLLDRAHRCMAIRDRVPTLLAIDFPERGDVVGAAAELNDELIARDAAGGTTP